MHKVLVVKTKRESKQGIQNLYTWGIIHSISLGFTLNMAIMIIYNNTYISPAFKWTLGKAKEPGHKKQGHLNSAMLTSKTIGEENTIRLSNRRNQSVVQKKLKREVQTSRWKIVSLLPL